MKYYFTADKMTVGYDGKPLIEEVDFSLEKGEILTLIGPNGAGKSTILKSITRQLSMIAGTVSIDGRNMADMTRSDIARTEFMTCEDVVATGRYPYTGRFGLLSDTDRMAVAEAMELVNALFCEVNPIPVKKALNLMGMKAGVLRRPLTEMEPANSARLEKAMKEYGIL